MDVRTRISATFAGHYDLAVYLSVILVIIGGIIVTQKNILIKISNIIIWLISFYLLVLTASRVSTFAFYGGMCLTLILLRRYLWIIPVTLIFVFSLVKSGDLNQRLLATIPAVRIQLFGKPTPIPTSAILPTPIPTIPVIAVANNSKITPVPTVFHHPPVEEFIPIDTDVGVARSGEIRFNVEWPRAITAFRKNPLTGTGLGSITLATDNDYLRTLGESGLLGFIAFTSIILFFIVKTLPQILSKKPDILPLIFFSAMITFLVNATLIDVFEASKVAYLFWIMMGIYYQSLQLKT
jgi:O-antigen ligase